MSGAIFGRFGRAPTIFRIFKRWLMERFVSGVRRQYSIRETDVQGVRIAIRAKKALPRCIRVGIGRENWVKKKRRGETHVFGSLNILCGITGKDKALQR